MRTQVIYLLNPDRALQAQLFQGIKEKNPAYTKLALDNFNAGMKAFGDLAVNNFHGLVGINGGELSQKDNFPTQPGKIAQVFFHGSDEPADMVWSQIFAVEDYRGTTEDKFTLVDITDGITFRSYLNGEKVELYTVSGAEASFPFELVGGGFQWLQTWLDDNKYWRLPNGLASAATKYAREQAENAYSVLTAAGYQTYGRVTDPTGQPAAYYDIASLNAAYVSMLKRLKTNSDYRAPNPRMVALYNSLDETLANRVPAIQTGEFTTSTGGTVKLNSNISLQGTPNIASGGFWLTLPGRKLRSAIRMDMTGFEDFNIYTYSGDRVFWGRYTHVRGDSDQVGFVPLT